MDPLSTSLFSIISLVSFGMLVIVAGYITSVGQLIVSTFSVHVTLTSELSPLPHTMYKQE